MSTRTHKRTLADQDAGDHAGGAGDGSTHAAHPALPQAVTTPAPLSAAERAARSHDRLEAARAALRSAHADGAAADEGLAAVERERRESEARLGRARERLGAARRERLAAEAELGIVAGAPIDEAAARERLTAARDAEAAARLTLEEAEGAAAGVAAETATRAGDLEAARAAVAVRVAQAEGEIATLEPIAAAAHDAAGRARLAARRGEYAEIRGRRAQALDVAAAAERELDAMVRALPAELDDWPELAALPVADLLPDRLSPEREVLERWRDFLHSLERHAGTASGGVGIGEGAGGVMLAIEPLAHDPDKLRALWRRGGETRAELLLGPTYRTIAASLEHWG